MIVILMINIWPQTMIPMRPMRGLHLTAKKHTIKNIAIQLYTQTPATDLINKQPGSHILSFFK